MGYLMRYAFYFGPQTLHVSMEGFLSFADSRLFRKMLAKLAEQGIGQDIRMNVEKLEHVDSTGLALLMAAHDAAKKSHRALVFVGPRGQVLDALNEASQYNALRLAAADSST